MMKESTYKKIMLITAVVSALAAVVIIPITCLSNREKSEATIKKILMWRTFQVFLRYKNQKQIRFSMMKYLILKVSIL